MTTTDTSTATPTARPAALALADEFTPIRARVDELNGQAAAIIVTDATQLTEMKRARTIRLEAKDLRCKVENRRKELKADILEAGRLIDGAAKTITALIEPIEQRMLEAETFAERAEKARRDDLRQHRSLQLANIGGPARFAYDLADLSEAQWETTLATARTMKREEEAAEKAKAEAEAERQERDRLERDRLAAENARLRAERDAAEAERKRAEAAKAAAEQAEAKARAKYLEELAERDAAERAAEAQAEAERKAKIAAERKAARAPDKAKLLALAATIEELARTGLPKVKDPESAAILSDTQSSLRACANRLEQRANNLA